ncbi:MAG: hypothetical protein RL199_1483, partial [Pseudomonadota bacterium]
MRSTCLAVTILALPTAAVAGSSDAADGTTGPSVAATWLEAQQSATVVREKFDASAGAVTDAAELAWTRRSRTLRIDVDVPVSASFVLRARLPYVVGDVQAWESPGAAAPSLATTNQTPDGTCFTADCTSEKTLVPVPGRVLRGGFGDPSVGFAWTVTDRPAPPPVGTYPRLAPGEAIVGLDYTAPLATVMDPTKPSRSPTSTEVFPVGQGTHRLDTWVRGRRAFLDGKLTPEAGVHYTVPIASAKAFDDCALPADQLTSVGRLACAPNAADTFWRGRTGLVPSHRAGFVL